MPSVNGKIDLKEGCFVLPREVGTPGFFQSQNTVFCERMKKAGLIEKCEEKPFFVLCEYASDLNGGYKIRIEKKGITVFAESGKEYASALATLYQAFVLADGIIPCAEIEDQPKYAYRGFCIDVCRHFVPVEELKKIAEQCALLKINVIRLHLSDDQGFRVESEKFPKLNAISSFRRLSPQDPLVKKGVMRAGEFYGGYYTKKELSDFIAYAEARGIEIIPEIELPGHASAILAAYPEYTCSGKPLSVKGTFGVHDRIFCAGNEKVYRFIEDLIGEIADFFPSKYFHIGGDEAKKTEWKKCPKCKPLIEKYGGTEKLHVRFVNRIVEYLKGIGKTAVVWNESAVSGDLNDNAVVQYWSELGRQESRMIAEIKKGRKFIFSDMNRFYCDYSYAEIPLKSTLLYEPNFKGQRVPSKNVLGIEAPLWTEWVCTDEEIERLIYPRLIAVAECCWKGSGNANEFSGKVKAFSENPNFSVLKPMPWNQATISGEESYIEIVKNITSLGGKYREMREYGENNDGGNAEIVNEENDNEGEKGEFSAVAFITEKLCGGYSEKEIKRVLEIMSEKRGENK